MGDLESQECASSRLDSSLWFLGWGSDGSGLCHVAVSDRWLCALCRACSRPQCMWGHCKGYTDVHRIWGRGLLQAVRTQKWMLRFALHFRRGGIWRNPQLCQALFECARARTGSSKFRSALCKLVRGAQAEVIPRYGGLFCSVVEASHGRPPPLFAQSLSAWLRLRWI